MEKKICMGTSIAPFNFEIQKRAVLSWLESGFIVISCNSKEEISIVKEGMGNLPITFIECDAECQEINNRKLPYISKILHSAAEQKCNICGYSNSDIIFHQSFCEIKDFIYENCQNGLMIIQRNEIQNEADIEKGRFRIHFDGIDTFFLDVKYCDLFDCYPLYVQSNWDAFIQKIAKKRGIRTVKLVNPVAFHIIHKQQWNFDSVLSICNTMITLLNIKNCSNPIRFFSLGYYDDLLNFTQNIVWSSNKIVNFSISSSPLGMKYDKCFSQYLSWVIEKFEIRRLELIPFGIWEEIGLKSYCSCCGYLSFLEKYCRNTDKIVEVISEKGKNDVVLFCPLCFWESNKQDKRVRKKQLYDLYLAPSGIKARQWLATYKEDLTGVMLRGFLDREPTKEDTFDYGILDHTNDAQVIISSKYFEEEIYETVKQYTSKVELINAAQICKIENGMVYILT